MRFLRERTILRRHSPVLRSLQQATHTSSTTDRRACALVLNFEYLGSERMNPCHTKTCVWRQWKLSPNTRSIDTFLAPCRSTLLDRVACAARCIPLFPSPSFQTIPYGSVRRWQYWVSFGRGGRDRRSPQAGFRRRKVEYNVLSAEHIIARSNDALHQPVKSSKKPTVNVSCASRVSRARGNRYTFSCLFRCGLNRKQPSRTRVRGRSRTYAVLVQTFDTTSFSGDVGRTTTSG